MNAKNPWPFDRARTYGKPPYVNFSSESEYASKNLQRDAPLESVCRRLRPAINLLRVS